MNICTLLIAMPFMVLLNSNPTDLSMMEPIKGSIITEYTCESFAYNEEDPVPPMCCGDSGNYTEEEVIVLTKMLWGEARGVESDTEKAAVIWCALNRVDAGYGGIIEVVTAPHQFTGYKSSNPVDESLKVIVIDVLNRWCCSGEGRVLPADYLWFTGDGEHNIFRNAWKSGEEWDWTLESPYES